MSKILGIIPARLASTRFPEKALVDIQGLPMVCRVLQQAQKSQALSEVIVATDHERIAKAVEDFGGRAIMTSTEHPSGTDRCREALDLHGSEPDYVINIQGDEPFIDPAQLDLLATLLEGETELATLVAPIADRQELESPTVMKVLQNQAGEAMYFSRTVVPYLRDVPREQWLGHYPYLKHVALYAYRSDVLRTVAGLPPSSLEQAESLEQLRWLEAGFRIKLATTTLPSVSIDTPADLERALQKFS